MAYQNNLGGNFDTGSLPNPAGGGGSGPTQKKPKRIKGGYTVQSGDNPALIAQKVFGDQRYLDVVLAALEGASLTSGMVLKLPDLTGYMKDLAAKGQLHEVSQGEWNAAKDFTSRTRYGAERGITSPYAQAAQTQTQTPATVQPDPMSTWLANNPAQTAAVQPTSNPSGVPPVGYGPNAWAPPAAPTTQTRTNNPALNYAALAARGTPVRRPLNPDGSFNLAAMPAYQAPKPTTINPDLTFTRGVARNQNPNWVYDTVTGKYVLNLDGGIPGRGSEFAVPPDLSAPFDRVPLVPQGQASGLYPLEYDPVTHTWRRKLPNKTMPKAPEILQLPWLEQGPPPPPGYAGIPTYAPPAGGGGYPYQPPGGGGGGGGGGGNDPGGYTGRGVPRRQPQPFYANQTSNTPGGYRSPQRAANSSTRTGLVTWRL